MKLKMVFFRRLFFRIHIRSLTHILPPPTLVVLVCAGGGAMAWGGERGLEGRERKLYLKAHFNGYVDVEPEERQIGMTHAEEI